MKNIKKIMLENVEYAIAFSIVWTFFMGCMVFLGVRDYSASTLLLMCVSYAIGFSVVLNAIILVLMLIEKVKFKIRLWKFKRALLAMETSYRKNFIVNAAGRENLDKFAAIYGLKREVGETDEQLRARIRKAIACDQVLNEKQGESSNV